MYVLKRIEYIDTTRYILTLNTEEKWCIETPNPKLFINDWTTLLDVSTRGKVWFERIDL